MSSQPKQYFRLCRLQLRISPPNARRIDGNIDGLSHVALNDCQKREKRNGFLLLGTDSRVPVHSVRHVRLPFVSLLVRRPHADLVHESVGVPKTEDLDVLSVPRAAWNTDRERATGEGEQSQRAEASDRERGARLEDGKLRICMHMFVSDSFQLP